ncbi:ranBP2-like and GRIP domain-containing protein 3 [Trichogramma pretiosum]|uniref:ranBP2-like and GRIP domain-containing protein 3 n=1 Tax=Trichogramma pretiosum TaxID=7493 RepID=UPI0006C994BA|nr:ranBP2-like and GRIP domain-containing protein 3 [Trichogramma pretiosum]
MLRTKKDVDRHVNDIFRKIPDETERNLRSYKIAELYFNVGDYENARRYLSRYLEEKKDAKAYKLMGQIHEAQGNKESALSQFKLSFELDGRQEDLILKICELLVDSDVVIDVNRAKYWLERAEKLFSHDKVVFCLKEKILSSEESSGKGEGLEHLIKAELLARPLDVNLRVKLLKHYMENEKYDVAYKHAMDIEALSTHRNSVVWYRVLCELFLKCKSSKHTNWVYWISYISVLERYAALAIQEQGNSIQKPFEALQAVYNFDQHLFEAKAQSFSSHPSMTESVFAHMWGQLNLHLASLLLLMTQREQGSWTEAGRLCGPLFLTAVHTKPIDLTASWTTHLDSQLKNQLQLWYREGNYRCSQAGHVLQDYARGNPKKLISSIEKFCSGSWRERVYQRIFVSKMYQKIRTSYFTNNNAMNPRYRLLTSNELKQYDEVSEEVWPYSLHHQIWPAIKSRSTNKYEAPQPNLSSHLFPTLQYTVYSLNQAGPATLSRLDIDAFLNAAVLCASAVVDEQQKNTFNPDKLPTLPADLTSQLCTEEQQKWWTAAYSISRKEMFDVNDTRQNLQHGLEVIRCIGNHGLHPVILVHLARLFNYRAKKLKEKNSESGDIPALEARADLYWSAAVPLLERMHNNQTIRSSQKKLFDYTGKEMNNMEITEAIEEGKLLLVQKLVKDKLYEQAIEALQSLKCPEASFEQGQIYKQLAEESIDNTEIESMSSEIRTQYIIILSKARNCFYLTLDRLRSPNADPKHPLNAELCNYITEVENKLKRIDPDELDYDRAPNDYDEVSEESYSSAHSDEQRLLAANSVPNLNNSNHHTPKKHHLRRTPKKFSTPQPNNISVLEFSRSRLIESRPSPERLDAQIRQLVHSVDSLKIQQREQHLAMISKLDELIKLHSDKDNQLKKSRSSQNQNVDDVTYHDDDVSFSNTSMPIGGMSRTAPLAPNLFAQRSPYPFMYPPTTPAAAALQNPYYSQLAPFADTNAAAAAVAAAAQMNYHHPVMPNTQMNYHPVMPDTAGLLTHGLFSPQTFTQPPPQQQPKPQPQLQHQLQPQQQPQIQSSQTSFVPHMVQQQPQLAFGDQKKIEPKFSFVPTNTNVLENAQKEPQVMSSTPTNRKPPPVNVVITKSDTMPSETSATQLQTFSVTVPPQHRLGVTPNVEQEPNVPHSYQISMPSQANIPTTVNLPPLSATMTITSPTQANDKNTSSVSVTSRHSISSDTVEVEHDPIPDFAPIIPLPDEVPVTTGEENEEELFCARAKLFRFVDKEWKERGIGNVKLLKNEEGKVRLLMRREQVLKICANHMLRKDMELSPMPNNEKAYMWVANDFADEELKLEKLCIRFKTVEEAQSFKEHFEKARDSLPDDSVKQSKPKTESSVLKKELSTKPVSTEAKVSENKLGGFSFTSTPILQQAKTPTTPLVQKKPEETSKPSPFATFTFGKSSNEPSKPGGFNFGEKLQEVVAQKPPSSMNNKPAEQKKPLSEMFKPAAGSWECQACYTVNPSNKTNCLACQTASSKQASSATAPAASNKPPVKNSLFEQFKPAQGSWECNDCYTRNNAGTSACAACNAPAPGVTPTTNSAPSAQSSLSAMFKPPADSWECKACYTRNVGSNQYCVACDAPSDPKLPPKPKPAGGFMISGSSDAKPSSFSFGMPPTTNMQASKQETAFNLSTKANETKPESTKPISIFGTNQASSGAGFSFGMQPPSTPPNRNSGAFSFGSPGKSFDFQFQAKSPIKSPERPETSDDEVEESEDVYFAPIIPLPDKIDVKTGEEDEDVLYSHRAKLFKFDTDTKEWKERGLGDIKLLKHKTTKKLRLVMRRDQVLKLCLNHAVSAAIEIKPKDDKTWMWSAGDYSEGAVEYIQFACRFKTPEIAAEFKKAVDDACKAEPSSEIAPEKKTPKATNLPLKEPSSDIEVVYEVQVSEDDKKAACELMLPENFYSYKNKADCPGCRGCRDEDKFSFENVPSGPVIVKANSPSTSATFNFGGSSNVQGGGFKTDFGSTKTPSLFGNSSSSNTTAKSTSFVFGGAKSDSTDSQLDNLKICEPSSKPAASGENVFSFGSSTSKLNFGSTAAVSAPTTTKSLFGPSAITTAPANSKPLFGSSSATTLHPSMVAKNLFSESKPTFGQNPPLLEEPKVTSANLFGGLAKSTSSTTSSIIFSTATPNMSIFGGQTSITPTFGSSLMKAQSTSVTDQSTSSTNTTTSSSSLFGSNITKTSMSTNAKPFASSVLEGNLGKSLFGTATTTSTSNQSLFGNNSTKSISVITTETSKTGLSLGSDSTKPIFGNLSSTSNESKSLFGGATTITPITNIFGSSTPTPVDNVFGKTSASSTNIFGGKPIIASPPQSLSKFGVASEAEDTSKKDTVSFLPTENALSFSALATKTGADDKPAFKVDPNFTFEGAGASVFGAKAANTSVKKTPSKDTSSKTQENDNDEDGDDENENGDEHDPYFEPIIPLPDAIEVRTGEEDEEKVFAHRAKLYRYDNNTKEWKERGTGEMKLLHHRDHGTYRLLLRREQVHKVVCNILVTIDLDMRPMNTSDRAWMWAGMNYAEPENPEIEQLAVRFKTPELAAQFKEAIDKAQLQLAEKMANQESKYDDTQPEESYEDYDDEYIGEDDEDDEDGDINLFLKRATLFSKNESDVSWNHVAMGNIKIIYDSELFGGRIIIETDNKEVVSDTVISMDTSMQLIDKECIWEAIDYAIDPPTSRSLKAEFSSSNTAQEMYNVFLDGQDFASKADIRG